MNQLAQNDSSILSESEQYHRWLSAQCCTFDMSHCKKECQCAAQPQLKEQSSRSSPNEAMDALARRAHGIVLPHAQAQPIIGRSPEK